MGKIIVIGSQKGGVGKTTTTHNLAYSLKELGKKVLTVDFDMPGKSDYLLRSRRYWSTGIYDWSSDDGSDGRRGAREL